MSVSRRLPTSLGLLLTVALTAADCAVQIQPAGGEVLVELTPQTVLVQPGGPTATPGAQVLGLARQPGDEALLITQPGEGSPVSSPVSVAGLMEPRLDGPVLVEVWDRAGNLLGSSQAATAQAQGHRAFETQVTFQVPQARPGWVVAWARHPQLPLQLHLGSVGVELLPPGAPPTLQAGPTEVPPERILIHRPVEGSPVQGTLDVEGETGPLPQAQLLLEVVNQHGQPLASQVVPVSFQGQRGAFGAQLSITPPAGEPLWLQATAFAPDGQAVHLTSVQLGGAAATPTATASPTASPTPTATPTQAPAAALPPSQVVLLSPLPRTAVTAPIRVAAYTRDQTVAQEDVRVRLRYGSVTLEEDVLWVRWDDEWIFRLNLAGPDGNSLPVEVQEMTPARLELVRAATGEVLDGMDLDLLPPQARQTVTIMVRDSSGNLVARSRQVTTTRPLETLVLEELFWGLSRAEEESLGLTTALPDPLDIRERFDLFEPSPRHVMVELLEISVREGEAVVAVSPEILASPDPRRAREQIEASLKRLPLGIERVTILVEGKPWRP